MFGDDYPPDHDQAISIDQNKNARGFFWLSQYNKNNHLRNSMYCHC